MRRIRSVAVVVLIAAGLAGALLLAAGKDEAEHERTAFSPRQREYLDRLTPYGGRYLSDFVFENCESGRWVRYHSTGDWEPFPARLCWQDRVPVETPRPLWMRP